MIMIIMITLIIEEKIIYDKLLLLQTICTEEKDECEGEMVAGAGLYCRLMAMMMMMMMMMMTMMMISIMMLILISLVMTCLT